jgi:hypothetical protein
MISTAVHYGFALQELPEIFFGKNDGLHNFIKRHALLRASRPDFAVAMLDVKFVFSQQPLAQVAVDFIDTLSQFMDGNVAEMRDLGTGLKSFFQPTGKRIGVRFD